MSDTTQALTATSNVVNNLVSESSGIIKELLHAAMASPLLAFFVGFAGADILEKQFKILSPDAAATIKGILAAALGVDMASAVLSDITGIFHIGASQNPDVVGSKLTTFAPTESKDRQQATQKVVATVPTQE